MSDAHDGFAVTADRLWDARGSLARPAVRVVGERIAGAEASLLAPTSCRGARFDFPGCTLLPGLIDTHVHLVMSAGETNEAIVAQVQSESDEQLYARAAANAGAALRAGLTTVRDCGGRGRVVQALRNAIARGDVAGPDVLACGAPITTARGHCWWLGLVADDLDAVDAACTRMLDEGADFLKVMATGGNMTPTSDPMTAQYDDATLARIAERARRAGTHAAAHVLSRTALPGVVAAGYRTIEHCDWRSAENTYAFLPALAREMVERRQFVGFTFSGLARRSLDPVVRGWNVPAAKRLDARFACERRTIDAGVAFTLHSDAGVRRTPIERFDVGLRCAAVELGLTPAEVLRSVTATAAEAIGLSDRGLLAPGMLADLIVVDGDPLRDLSRLGSIRAVLKRGRWATLTP